MNYKRRRNLVVTTTTNEKNERKKGKEVETRSRKGKKSIRLKNK